jgi:MraZ protein
VVEKLTNGFLGTCPVTLDEKGRINIPAKFKVVMEQENNPNMVICVMDQYLIVFPQKEWTLNQKQLIHLEEKLNHLPAFSKEDRERLRGVYAPAEVCKIKSGKILIPSSQRETAGLVKDVVLVGMSKTFEIWAKDRWETYQAKKVTG